MSEKSSSNYLGGMEDSGLMNKYRYIDIPYVIIIYIVSTIVITKFSMVRELSYHILVVYII